MDLAHQASSPLSVVEVAILLAFEEVTTQLVQQDTGLIVDVNSLDGVAGLHLLEQWCLVGVATGRQRVLKP